jgi:uncharacterized membrane protein YeaQ/YmgE (transglycosylase-associated protein family)
VAGIVGRVLTPGDAFRHVSGPGSWAVSIVLGLAGALLGYLIFTVGLGIGDDQIFDFGGVFGAIIGVIILLPVLTIVMRVRNRKKDEAAMVGQPPFTSA